MLNQLTRSDQDENKIRPSSGHFTGLLLLLFLTSCRVSGAVSPGPGSVSSLERSVTMSGGGGPGGALGMARVTTLVAVVLSCR